MAWHCLLCLLKKQCDTRYLCVAVFVIAGLVSLYSKIKESSRTLVVLDVDE